MCVSFLIVNNVFSYFLNEKKQEHVFINSSFTDLFESVSSIYVINEHNTLHNVQLEIHECIIMKESNYKLNDVKNIDNSLTFNGKE